MIEITHNGQDVSKAVEAALTVVGQNFTVTLALSERSLDILYWQAVNHGRDATEAFGDIESNEVEQLVGEPAVEAALISPGQTVAIRQQMADEIGKILRRYLVRGIDDEDLIDTGLLRLDAEQAPIRVEGI